MATVESLIVANIEKATAWLMRKPPRKPIKDWNLLPLRCGSYTVFIEDRLVIATLEALGEIEADES